MGWIWIPLKSLGLALWLNLGLCYWNVLTTFHWSMISDTCIIVCVSLRLENSYGLSMGLSMKKFVNNISSLVSHWSQISHDYFGSISTSVKRQHFSPVLPRPPPLPFFTGLFWEWMNWYQSSTLTKKELPNVLCIHAKTSAGGYEHVQACVQVQAHVKNRGMTLRPPFGKAIWKENNMAGMQAW